MTIPLTSDLGRFRSGACSAARQPLVRRTTGLFSSGLRAALAMLEERRSFNRLLECDDRMLDDIGVTRSDVYAASRTPFGQSAANELRRAWQARRSLRN